jgi:hypothetical protein
MESFPQNQEDLPITLERATPAYLEVFMELEQSVRNPKTYPSSSTENEALDELTSSQVFFIKKDGKIIGNIGYQMQSEEQLLDLWLILVTKDKALGVRHLLRYSIN